jgi:hypothetical protein
MFYRSVDDLQALAEDLQDLSRFERGRLNLTRGPAQLRAAVAAAVELLGGRLELRGEPPPDIEGPWDGKRLARAIAGFAEAASRAGDGSKTVETGWAIEPGSVTARLATGAPAPGGRAVNAEVGFAFFRARAFIIAMGGEVACQRGDHFCAITLRLPR